MAASLPSNLNQASGASIIAALSNLRRSYNARNAWLDPATNKYVVDTIEKLKSDISSSSLSNQEVIDYLATSVLIHCFNGWTYLSNSIASLLEGDYGNAIHNAYYAELRSIMSFLGSQGIGVFDKSNVLVDRHGIVHPVTPPKRPTHKFVKEAFDEWLNNPANSQTILSLFTVEDATLQDWIATTGFSSLTASELSANKLKQWSLDLNTIGIEQKFRNYVSYNPLRYDLSSVTLADNIEARMKFIIDLWNLSGPNKLFPMSILRNTYENLYSTIPFDIKDLEMNRDWKRIFSDMGKNADDIMNQNIINFLRRDINSVDNLVFQYANTIQPSTPIIESDIEPFGIMSRACIMLMLNTKILESLLRQSGTSKEDLKFWFDNIGLKSGLWNLGSEPNSFVDLWSDVEIEIEDIASWLEDPTSILDSYHSKHDLHSSRKHVRNFAKAYLWNIGL